MVQYTEWRSISDGSIISSIPDSVVTRPEDNRDGDVSSKDGVQIEVSQEWPQIGARISSNTSGVTQAQIFDVSDGTLMGETDISNLSSGDNFTIDLDNNLQPNGTYNFVLWAEGSNYTIGLFNDPDFPYVSNDEELEIVAYADGETTSATFQVPNIDQVGNVGFN